VLDYKDVLHEAVRWGDPPYDEMMIGWIEYTVAGISLDHRER